MRRTRPLLALCAGDVHGDWERSTGTVQGEQLLQEAWACSSSQGGHQKD